MIEMNTKELLGNLRSLKRGLEERAKAEVANGEYQLVSTICETLKVETELSTVLVLAP